MGQRRIYPVRDTALSLAIRSIRRRLRLGQIGFTIVLTGKGHAGEISRWEAGQVIPGLKALVALLKLADTPAEREPILEALRAQRIEELLSNLQAAGLIAAPDHETSIHPAGVERNRIPQVPNGPATAVGEVAPAPQDSPIRADGGDSSSDSLGIAAGSAQATAYAGPAPPREAA